MDFDFVGIKKKFLPLLFTTAFRSEAEVIFRIHPFQLIDRVKNFQLFQHKPEPVFMLITGVGHHLKLSSLERWLKDTAPALLINFGICGGLDTTLPLFQNYLVNRVYHLGEPEISLELHYPELFKKLLNYFPAYCLLTSEHPVLQEPLRKQLHQRTTCQLLDMEGYKLAKTAINYSLPIILLKQLTDYCDKGTVRNFRENQSTWQNNLRKGLTELLEVLSGSG
jgi:nucleoside phosphorylase